MIAARAPRTDEATPARRIPGEAGVWVLIFGDLLIFFVLFVAFLVQRSQEPTLFEAAQSGLNQTAGMVNTVLLLTSSLLVAGGVRAFVLHRGAVAARLFGGALLCGAGFVAGKYFEYRDKTDAGLGPRADDFHEFYFLMTGLHLFHVLVGMGCLIFMVAQARRPATSNRLLRVEACATYWHMVDVLWIALFALLYMVH